LDFAITNRSQLAEIKAVSNYWKHETANTQEARQRHRSDKKGEAQQRRALGIRRLDSTAGWYSKAIPRLYLCHESRGHSGFSYLENNWLESTVRFEGAGKGKTHDNQRSD
jgi:hypothetical protein